MAFDAATTSPLDFTFRPHLDLTGTIPDPSEAQVRAFNASIDQISSEGRKALTELAADTDTSDEDRRARAAQIDEQVHERQLDAVAELCSGEPSRDQVAQLPYRVQVGFIAWLTKELRDPTTLPATKPPLAAVR